MEKPITLTVTSAQTRAEIRDTITAGDSDAYPLSITFSDLTAITGTVRFRFVRGDDYWDRDATVAANVASLMLEPAFYAATGTELWVSFEDSNLYTPLHVYFRDIRVPSGNVEAATSQPYPAWVAEVAEAEADRATAEENRSVWEAFDSEAQYAVGNKAYYLGSSYICHTIPPVGTLPTDTGYWSIIVQKGDTGDVTPEAQAAASAATAQAALAQGYAAQLAAGVASPAGTYSNLAALIADNPDHSKIYITLEDGNWCYHNGSAFVAGGVYQATALETDKTLTVSGAAADAKVTGDKVGELKSAIDNNYLQIVPFNDEMTITPVSGSAINTTTGTPSSLYGFSYADVPVSAGDKLRISGWASSATYSPAFWDDDNFIKSTEIIDTSTGEFSNVEVEVPQNATRLLINGRPGYNISILITKQRTNENSKTFLKAIYPAKIEQAVTLVSGKLVNTSTGDETTASGFEYATFNVNSGDLLQISGYSANDTTQHAFWDESKLVWTTGLINYSTGIIKDVYVIVPKGATRLFINGRPSVGASISISKIDGGNAAATEYWETYFKNSIVHKYDLFDISNLERRALNAEHKNDFAWAAFDKPYFVFVHDDTNSFLSDAYTAFHRKQVPLCAATISENIDATKLEILNNIVADGGEILAHYQGSPKANSPDSEWLRCTRDPKYALENMGFDVRGVVIANATQSNTAKGEKYCRRYFDYGTDGMGQSMQYKIIRKLMLNYASLDAFKAKLDSDALVNGIHAFGFHGNRPDETWITESNLEAIIDYIVAKGNCEIVTFSYLFDNFGSSVLAEQIKTLMSQSDL